MPAILLTHMEVRPGLAHFPDPRPVSVVPSWSGHVDTVGWCFLSHAHPVPGASGLPPLWTREYPASILPAAILAGGPRAAPPGALETPVRARQRRRPRMIRA